MSILFIGLQKILPQHLLSRLTGALAECKTPWIKNLVIRLFHHHFKINMQDAQEENPYAYENFNAFFTRALKADVRDIDQAIETLVSPADGCISEIGRIDYARLLQAKGRTYSLTSLLGGSPERAQPFLNGHFATVYLSPKDYHRVHMPIKGTLRETLYIPGDLWSVNATTAAHVDDLFARNERLVALFDTQAGPMAMILVGAMIVAGIEVVWQGQVAPPSRHHPLILGQHFKEDITLEKGAEMGRFKLGSTVIMLFTENQVNWVESLQAQSPVQLGQTIAHRIIP